MPTYRNNTNNAINYVYGKNIYTFPPKKDYPCNFWIPYQELGLELVNAEYPPVPSKILISGKFLFSKGTERKFNIEHCEKYSLKLSVENGTLRFYTGSSHRGVDIEGEYSTLLSWEYAPYIRLVGITDGVKVSIHAENESVNT